MVRSRSSRSIRQRRNGPNPYASPPKRFGDAEPYWQLHNEMRDRCDKKMLNRLKDRLNNLLIVVSTVCGSITMSRHPYPYESFYRRVYSPLSTRSSSFLRSKDSLGTPNEKITDLLIVLINATAPNSTDLDGSPSTPYSDTAKNSAPNCMFVVCL